MDAIKAKMVKLSRETETANARANKFDDELEAYKKEAEKIEQQLATVTTTEHFAALTQAEIEDYVATGEPLHCAGGLPWKVGAGWSLRSWRAPTAT